MDILIYLGIGIVILVAILIWRFIKRRTLFYRAKKEGTVADARPTLEEKKEWKEREEEQPCFKISPLRSPPSRKERKKRKKGKRRENLSSFSISVGQAAARRKTPPPHELTASESVRFRAFWPCKMFPDAWQSLFVYIFSGEEGHRGVQSDFRRRKTAPADSYDFSSSSACQDIRRGTEILVCPELEGARFNPPFAKVIWLEDWHCVEFRMQAKRPLNEDRGRVAFYVGPVLIGEMTLYVTATDEPRVPGTELQAGDPIWEETGASAYRAIFVSYSHKDTDIVDRLESAYRALGDEYLRDIAALRSGEQWNPALLEKIEHANIFQLCWSQSAKKSQHVEAEWRHALNLQRLGFIRPTYWEEPMPTPPRELRDIHFAYIPTERYGLKKQPSPETTTEVSIQ